jgi:hypothetical protein
MSFSAIAHRLLKLRPRRGGGFSSYFSGDVSAVEALAVDIMLASGSTGRTAYVAAIEAATDALIARGALSVPAGAQVPMQSPYALEITNVKPAGTGSPAMPSTHRLYRAYPGITYRYPVAVRGGYYPYTFSLSGAPAGMSIDQDGRITWLNPQANSGTVTLTVTDAMQNPVVAQFAVTVSTNGFVFVDGNYSGTSTGSITQPYKSLNEMAAAQNGNPTGIVYIRETAAPYVPTNYPSGSKESLDAQGSLYFNCPGRSNPSSAAPETLLAIPGESPVIDLGGNMFLRSDRPWVDGLTFRRGAEYTWKITGAANYWGFWNCRFIDCTATSGGNRNQGNIFAINEGTGRFGYVGDCEISGNSGAQGIGSFYWCDDMLIERNYFHDGGFNGLTGFATPISLKDECSRTTMRRNTILIPSSGQALQLFNEPGGDGADFSYNKILHATGGLALYLIDMPWNGFVGYRNTIIGQIRSNVNHTSAVFDRNVHQGSFVSTQGLTLRDNLQATSGLVDSNGNLLNTTNIGRYGAQIPGY